MRSKGDHLMTQSPQRERSKAVVYVTCDDHLLVLRQTGFPEIGLQPPGGAVEAQEDARQAALREVQEETGLVISPRDLHILGLRSYDFEADDLRHRHHRHFFHAPITSDVTRRWSTVEKSPDGGGAPIELELFWLPLNQPIALHAELDAMLRELRRRLGVKLEASEGLA